MNFAVNFFSKILNIGNLVSFDESIEDYQSISKVSNQIFGDSEFNLH